MPKKPQNVTSITGKLASKQTFLMLEGAGCPWQFGMNQAFGIQIYAEFYANDPATSGDR